MTLKFHWFLPTNGGDGRHVVGGGHGVGAGAAGRPASVSYLGQVARAAEDVGFEAALTPTGAWCDDAWLSTAMLSQVSERLKFLVAFRPGLTSPYLAAQMAGTFQNLSGGRLLLNVVTGGESHEQRMYGDFLDKDARYARCERVPARRAVAVARRDRHLPGRAPAGGGRASSTRSPTRCPRSTSAAPRRRPARSRPGTPTSTSPGASRPPPCARRSTGSASSPRDEGREVRFGIRMHTITRDTAEEAWAEADRLLAGIDPAAIEKVQAGLRRSESEGQRRMLDLQQRQHATASRSTPTSGPASAWSAAARAPRWSAATSRSPTASRSTPRSASTSSSSPATRTSRAPTGSARACCRSWPSAAAGSTRPRSRHTSQAVPFAARGRPRDRTAHRRRGRQPQAGLAHAGGGDHVARRLADAEPDLVVDLADLGPALLDWQDAVGRGPRRRGRRGRPGRGAPARRTRPPTPGCSSCSSTGSPAAVGLRGRRRPADARRRPRTTRSPPSCTCARCWSSSARPCPTPALYVLDHEHDRPEAYDDWLARSRPLVDPLLARTTGALA